MRMLPWMMVFSPVTAERRMMKMPPRDSVDCFSLNSLVPGARAGTKSPTLSFHHGQLVVFFFFFWIIILLEKMQEGPHIMACTHNLRDSVF